jgi:hypothetical protein
VSKGMLRCVLGSLLLVAGAAAARAETVTVSNDSSFAIYQFFLSPADQDEWGPDQLRDQVIASGDSFDLQGVPCDTFDVMLVDEDGDQCVIAGVDICGGDQTWIIEDEGLLACQGWGE